jgi:hypothetical protein
MHRVVGRMHERLPWNITEIRNRLDQSEAALADAAARLTPIDTTPSGWQNAKTPRGRPP